MDDQVAMTIGRDTAGLMRVSAAVDAFLTSRAAPPHAAYRVQLVLEEAVTNVIKYAWPDPAAACAIHICVAREDEPAAFVIRVEDDGRAFNPLLAPPPDFDTPADLRSTGGLGLHLIRQVTRSASYRRADGRNILEMRIACDA